MPGAVDHHIHRVNPAAQLVHAPVQAGAGRRGRLRQGTRSRRQPVSLAASQGHAGCSTGSASSLTGRSGRVELEPKSFWNASGGLRESYEACSIWNWWINTQDYAAVASRQIWRTTHLVVQHQVEVYRGLQVRDVKRQPDGLGCTIQHGVLGRHAHGDQQRAGVCNQ